MRGFRKIGALAVLIAGFGILGFEREKESAPAVLSLPAAGQTLTADGGAPPAPPIPVPPPKGLLTADGGAPPSPPIPVPKIDSILTT